MTQSFSHCSLKGDKRLCKYSPSQLSMSDFCCTSKISTQTNDCVMSMVFWTCIYCLKIVEQSKAATIDLTNDQGVSMVIWTHICHFEVVKQASVVTVDYIKMGGWHCCNMVASISINKFYWLSLIYLVAMKLI
jgi:hypothetical protein